MIRSTLCDILDIDYPIIQGGMAWVADAVLAAAVSNAGGLGLIAAMNSNGEQLRAELLLQRMDMLGDRGLGEMQSLGSLGETHVLADSEEGSDAEIKHQFLHKYN